MSQSPEPAPAEQPESPRKPYEKPQVEAIELRVKDDVLAVCRTQSVAQPGIGCKTTPCFS